MELVYHRFRGYDAVGDRVQRSSLVANLIRESMTLPRETLVDMARSIPLGAARARVLREIDEALPPAAAKTPEPIPDNDDNDDDGSSGGSDSSYESESSSPGVFDAIAGVGGDYGAVGVFDAIAGVGGDYGAVGVFDDDDSSESSYGADVFSATTALDGSTAVGDASCPYRTDGLVRSLMARVEALEGIVLSRR
jgi:hypothetical protein